MRVYTIGHSTRSAAEFISLLREHGIATLVDIRRYPGSKRHPHFGSEAMQRWLPEHGIAYVHMPQLGGRRKASGDSPNTALRNEQFRAYADYMATDEFRAAIDALLAIEGRVAIMCAEAVPWRCHRGFVSDELVRRGVEVVHVTARNAAHRHVMNELARVEGDRLVYAAEQQSLRL